MKLFSLISAFLLISGVQMSHAATPGSQVPKHEAMVSFESEGVPSYVKASKNSTISISEARYIDGRKSLKWSWSGGPADLVIEKPIPFLAEAPKLRGMRSGSTFAVWVYNARPLDSKLRFNFGTGEETDCEFEYGLDYTGWRTCWVMFNRDMQGKPREGMDILRITSPPGIEEGELYIDSVVLAANVDARHQYPDYQAPFVFGGDVKVKSHWLPRMDLMGQWSKLPTKPSTAAERAAVEQLELKCEAAYLDGSASKDSEIDELVQKYDAYQIEPVHTGLRGRHVYFHHQRMVLPEGAREAMQSEFIDIKDFQQHLLEIAIAFRLSDASNPHKAKLRMMFVAMAKHLLDQGWAEGSCQGTIHHLGYSIRELVPAALLMRDELAAEGLLNPISRSIVWYLNTPLILDPDGVHSNMDYYNTQAMGQLMSLLIMPDGDEKVGVIKHYSSVLSKVMAHETPGNDNGFKIDGTAFHHNGHYPAYALSAFNNASTVINWLSNTPFETTKNARFNFRRALLATRIYSNTEWGIGMSGRHPFGGRELTGDAFLLTALSGDPVTDEREDREVLAAALRLSPKLAQHPDVVGLDIVPEPTPQGHWTYNYAAAGIHRYDEKMVTLKGYNNNVWASEIYTRDNRFGRYQSHGSITILNARGKAASGYTQDGWDWNRLPGTTGVHLPLDQLESPRNGTLMERSKESFAGSSQLSGQFGAFATIIRDDWLPGSQGLLARKSVFCFENRIICLGTGITSPNEEYATETTLFQNALQSGSESFWCDTTTPVTVTVNDSDANPDRDAIVLADAYQNGYYIPASQQVLIKRDIQDSMHNKTKEPTRGLFGSAWINHGLAPKDASYEYAIILDTDIESMIRFKEAMANKKSQAYQVLRKDNQVHMVQDTDTNVTGIACFEPVSIINHAAVRSVSYPCLIMFQPQLDGTALISVCSPDLNLKDNVSTPIEVTILLQGAWTHEPDDSIKSLRDGDTTTLTFICVDGLPVEAVLQQD